MIVRKPYAFLIKNFRLIHFFMLVFSSYILYKSNILFNFFKDYSSTRQIIVIKNMLNIYIPPLVFIFSLFVILFSIIIFILLKEKDKPKSLYLFIILYYIIFIIYAFISRMTINTIILDGIAPKASRIIRDISLIIFIIQIGFVALLLVRSLGFDIKKFHFGEDLQSLKIDAVDNEEIEITTGIDTDKMIRNLEMKKEDIKAFYFENKIVIFIIVFIVAVILPTTLIVRHNVTNKRYMENEAVDLVDFNLKITNSYITKQDYKGLKILKGNNSYLVLKFNITNLGSIERGITLNNLRIEANDKIYSPNTTYYEYFADFGNGYYEQKIDKNTSKDYIAVYVIDDNVLQGDLIARYTDNLSYKDKEINALYKRIIIKPTKMESIISKDAVVLNEKLNFNESFLEKTSLIITSYGIKENYAYTIDNKEKYIVNNKGLVLKLSYVFNIDPTVNYIVDFSDLVSKYSSLIYTYNGKEYTEILSNITPVNYTDNSLFFRANNMLENATNIRLVFVIRNIKYTYAIK